MKNSIKLVLLIFCLTLFRLNSAFSQKTSEDHRRVLISDSCKIFNLKFPAMEFGESYFMFFNEYDVVFSEDDYIEHKLNCKKFNSQIKVFKSMDNKKLMCVFPKTAVNGIESLDVFLDSNFSSNCKAYAISKKTTLIEVRESFDELDSKSEKGFN